MSQPGQYRRNSSLLGGFVLFSVLAHGLLLLLPGREAENDYRVEFSNPIQVTVISSQGINNNITNTATVISQVKHQGNITETIATSLPAPYLPTAKNKEAETGDSLAKSNVITTKPRKITDATPVIEKQRLSELDTAADSGEPVAETTMLAKTSINHLLHQLRSLIKARFTYPRIARRMGWEGLVALSLHIEDDGSLHNVSIARSSGHKVLDENARSTVEDIGRLQLASSFIMHSVDTEIEVLYQLTD